MQSTIMMRKLVKEMRRSEPSVVHIKNYKSGSRKPPLKKIRFKWWKVRYGGNYACLFSRAGPENWKRTSIPLPPILGIPRSEGDFPVGSTLNYALLATALFILYRFLKPVVIW